jgi:hypothetical protein
MNLIERMPDLRGCFLLTPGGSRRVSARWQFSRRRRMTQALAAPIAFCEHYRNNQDTRLLIGLVIPITGQPGNR